MITKEDVLDMINHVKTSNRKIGKSYCLRCGEYFKGKDYKFHLDFKCKKKNWYETK